MRWRFAFCVVLWLVLSLFTGAWAEDKPNYLVEVRVYRVMTNISGDTSQTLPGAAGSVQVIHERLDDIDLVMEGETLTWNGRPEPNSPLIETLAKPKLLFEENTRGSFAIGTETSSLQYFEPREDGLFELRTFNLGVDFLGIYFRLAPHRLTGQSGVLDVEFSLEFAWVKDREKIEGVELNVGKPILDKKSVQDHFGARINEWVCYQTEVSSRSHLFIFVRISPGDAAIAYGGYGYYGHITGDGTTPEELLMRLKDSLPPRAATPSPTK